MMIADVANGPAKIIKEFRKKGKKPILNIFVFLFPVVTRLTTR